MNPLILVPGASALLFTVFEMPINVKKVFFKIPIWISSSVIAIAVGAICRGVLGPMTGFMTELILFPGLFLAKKHFEKREKKDKEGNYAFRQRKHEKENAGATDGRRRW